MQPVKAFTIIELIMVVVIIGVMAIFAVPNYNRSVAKTFAKTGSNNLLILYSAQKIRNTASNPYEQCLTVGECNTDLNLSIIANGFTYACAVAGGNPPTSFDCRAARTDGSFTLRITDINNVVCCQAGACPAGLNPPIDAC